MNPLTPIAVPPQIGLEQLINSNTLVDQLQASQALALGGTSAQADALLQKMPGAGGLSAQDTDMVTNILFYVSMRRSQLSPEAQGTIMSRLGELTQSNTLSPESTGPAIDVVSNLLYLTGAAGRARRSTAQAPDFFQLQRYLWALTARMYRDLADRSSGSYDTESVHVSIFRFTDAYSRDPTRSYRALDVAVQFPPLQIAGPLDVHLQVVELR